MMTVVMQELTEKTDYDQELTAVQLDCQRGLSQH